MRTKYQFSEFFWSAFSRIWTVYSVQMRENTDQKNSEYGHFSRSAKSYYLSLCLTLSLSLSVFVSFFLSLSLSLSLSVSLILSLSVSLCLLKKEFMKFILFANIN